MINQRSKRHHYVPQGFLRFFSYIDKRGGKFLWVYKKRTETSGAEMLSNPRSVKSIAHKENYYCYINEKGENVDEIEKRIASIEEKALKIISHLRPRVENNLNISADDREILSFYIALQYVRTPAYRDEIKKLQERVLKTAVNILPAEEKDSSEIKKQLIENGDSFIHIEEWASLFPVLEGVSLIGKALYSKNWQFFISPSKDLITSDNPVFWSNKGFPFTSIFHPDSEVIINLKKDLTLVITYQPGDCTVYEMNSTEKNKFIYGTVRAAKEFVYSNKENDPDLTNMINKLEPNSHTQIIY